MIEASISFPIAVFGISWAWRLSRQSGRFSGPWGGLAFGAVFVGGLLIDEVIGLVMSVLPALEAHTRLLLGRYLEYKVTEKA